MFGTTRFEELLREASSQLRRANPDKMSSGRLLDTPNEVSTDDVELFFRAVDAGLVELKPGGRFNTLDRPTADGRWGLLSRSSEGGWFNAEYLPQVAAYAEAVLDLGYPSERVLFELPARSLQLDLAVLDDRGQVVVLGEAKRSTSALGVLARGAVERFGQVAPTEDSKRRGDEQRQLAWRLWTVRPRLTWLIGPGHREAFETTTGPLGLTSLPLLPRAAELGLEGRPTRFLSPPKLV